MNLTGSSIVAGRDLQGEGPAWRAVAAETGEPLGPQMHDASPEQVAQATRLSASVAREYRAIPPHRRAAFLDACAKEIEALGGDLINRAALESGLPPERLIGERGRTCGQLRMFADLIRSGDALGVRIDPPLPDRLPLPRADLRLRKVPVGPVAVFGASNFPLAFSVAGGDTASALAAGCPVVVKAHPAHPGTSELVARAITRAAESTGMPAAVFSLLIGRSTAVGQALVRDPRIAAVGFTGSRAGGLALVEAANARPVPIPVHAEMSSVNPVIVLEGALADPQSTAHAYLASLTNGSGQFCTNPGLLLLPTGEKGDAFCERVANTLTHTAGQVMLTPEIAHAFTAGVQRWMTVDGVRVVAQGVPGPSSYAPAPVVLTCDAATYAAHEDLTAEVFGAAGLIVRWRDVQELAALMEHMEGQLTATLHGSDIDLATAEQLLPVLEERAGRILWGGWPTGVEVSHAMVHGGPWPATSTPTTTSVGTMAVERWLRPVCYQGFPDTLLPQELRTSNPLGVARYFDGQLVPRTQVVND
ncbi:aldehyde dehydrogenase (NADP(+)) [Streptomyces longwoodensis]|uniref:aldehyde dehydrogenase (NADP(+)) n=1 Tax=Streptomyces longwoodensis TaxID=68231 RepID=UPI002E81B907|nr:aldehyde dehydrogenase (NADP(+)) [Streptomyces longwoodensis]WUC55647.1 aldehyde dehydrogenase (NADP(+)) [Streptomyces longwoodensis]WUC62234.1 aldehyde dehydrogenase (NADP(+)) [Streptomyces longwoodensis]